MPANSACRVLRFDCHRATVPWSGNITTGGATTPRATKIDPYSSSRRRLNSSRRSGQWRPFGEFLKNADSAMHGGGWGNPELCSGEFTSPGGIGRELPPPDDGIKLSQQRQHISTPCHAALQAAKALIRRFDLSSRLIVCDAQLYPCLSNFPTCILDGGASCRDRAGAAPTGRRTGCPRSK